MHSLTELLDKYGPSVVAKETGVRADDLRRKADNGAIVVNNQLYIPSRNNGEHIKIKLSDLSKYY